MNNDAKNDSQDLYTKDENHLENFLPEIHEIGIIEKGQFNPEKFYRIPFQLRAVIMRKTLKIKDIQQLKIGDIISMTTEDGSIMNVVIYINGVPLFYGETVINGEKFGIRITNQIDEKPGPEKYLTGLNLGGITHKTKPTHKNNENKILENKDRFVDVDIQIRVEIGQTTLKLKKILQLGAGTLINLDKDIKDPLTLYGSNVPIFSGEIVTMSEDYIGFRITGIIEQ